MKIAIANKKGGTGKTTTALNIAYGLSRLKHRVALVDMDPQHHLSQYFEMNGADTVYSAMLGKAEISSIQKEVGKNLLFFPASEDMEGADLELFREPGPDIRLKRVIKNLEADFVIIDTPPNFGLLTMNALMAVDYLIIPIELHMFSIQGLASLLDEVKGIQEINEGLQVLGILCTRYDQRTRVQKDLLGGIREHFGPLVFDSVIRQNTYIPEAQANRENLFEFRKGKTKGAVDYLALCKEIKKRVKGVKRG